MPSGDVFYYVVFTTPTASIFSYLQHARAKGGVGGKHKDALQQASRKAKRAVKSREEECKNVRFPCLRALPASPCAVILDILASELDRSSALNDVLQQWAPMLIHPVLPWKQAQAFVQQTEDGLKALTGPFRLKKTVREALSRGLLMPFPLSVQRGKAAARPKEGQNMREASTALRTTSKTTCWSIEYIL